MNNKTKIKFSIHLPIICIILSLHFLASGIFPYFYLKVIENQVLQKAHSHGKLYLQGDYKSPFDTDTYKKLPREYAFVFVNINNEKAEEIYYSKKGEKVEVHYTDGKIQQINRSKPFNFVSLVIPLLGFALAIFSILHQMLRTGEIFIWQQSDKQDRIERVCYLYGLPFTFLGIFILVIKELWLK